MAGIYVHIPFCKSRCIYCGFYSTTLLHRQDEYVDAILKEMDQRQGYLRGEDISTIYIGGGTPSMLTNKNLQRLCAALTDYSGRNAEEFTVECNPDDVTDKLIEGLVEAGVNRVSMGTQTFSDKRLAFLRRRHRAEDAINAVSRLRHGGISNISIDLMFGFPNETMDDLRYDIDKALTLDVEHISAYSLMYEEGTPLYKMLEEKAVREIDEELSNAMYEELCSALGNAGYEHYEISNFARKGFRSLHNSSYWKAIPYLGLGAAAHSFDGDSRQWNVSDVDKYISSVLSSTVDEQVEQVEILTDDEKYNDLIATALRTCDGIDLHGLKDKYRNHLLIASKDAIEKGWMVINDNHIHFTKEGINISDSIMVDLII